MELNNLSVMVKFRRASQPLIKCIQCIDLIECTIISKENRMKHITSKTI